MAPAITIETPEEFTTVSVHVPHRANGDRNWGAVEAIEKAVKRIAPEAFDPQPVSHMEIAATDGHTSNGSGIIPEPIARAMLRDLALDDDMGAPGEPPRCKTGVCDE